MADRPAGERLAARALPGGFVLTAGDEGNPGGEWELTYGRAAEPEGPRAQLGRRLTAEPVENVVAPCTATEVRGRPGIVSEGPPSPDFVVYEPGRPGDSVAVMPPSAPAECRSLPPGALTRAEVTSRYSRYSGTDMVQAKLVRLSEIRRSADWESICSSQPCTDGMVA